MGDNQPAVCYGISSYESNAMKSANPHSGVYEAETSRTLDLNGGNPACNQGGMAVVCLEGNGSRPSHRGDGYSESETMYTLNSTEYHAVALENHPQDSRVKIREDGKVQTLSSRMGTGGDVPLVFGRQHDVTDDDITPSLCAKMGTGGNNVPMVLEPYTSSKASYHQHFTNDGKAETLVASDYKDPSTVTYQEHTGIVDACIGKGTSNQLANNDMFVANTSVVRRLTPLECERLQGFPDHWTDIGDWVDSKGKKHKGESDSPRYKALGNSIALPFWQWMAEKMVKYVDEQTMASLFDGIGGFPLVFSRCGCTPVWASEIEEFPIAVTKIRFPE
jgi:DNA (cytosine-5)-methyltransferase 1